MLECEKLPVGNSQHPRFHQNRAGQSRKTRGCFQVGPRNFSFRKGAPEVQHLHPKLLDPCGFRSFGGIRGEVLGITGGLESSGMRVLFGGLRGGFGDQRRFLRAQGCRSFPRDQKEGFGDQRRFWGAQRCGAGAGGAAQPQPPALPRSGFPRQAPQETSAGSNCAPPFILIDSASP